MKPYSKQRQFVERDEQIMELWLAGATASTIARVLHLVSRNVVIGCVNRAKGRDDERAWRRLPKVEKKPRVRKKPAKKLPPPVNHAPLPKPPEPKQYAPAPLGGVNILDLKKNECRWPLWNTRGYTRLEDKNCCGNETPEHATYCEYCQEIAYNRRSTSEGEAA